MGDLLKEAIADAKAVRETALQNAKMALEEAFTPQLKSMLSAKLKEDEFEDEEVPMEDEFGDEEEIPAEEGDYMEDDEIPGEEVPGEVPLEGEGEVIEINGVKYAPVGEAEVPGEEFPGEEDELDLESVIRQLETEIAEGEDEEDTMDETKEKDDDDTKIKEQDDAYDEKASTADKNDGKSSSDLAEVQINGRAYRVVEGPEDKDNAHVQNVEGDEQPEHVGDEETGVAGTPPLKSEGTDDEYEVDESLFREQEDEEELDEVDKSSTIGTGDNVRGNTDKSSGIGTGDNSLSEELREYKEAVRFLKNKLHEVNILNAKLLFTNKLFKGFSLDNNQKLRVVETFDRAQTTREIKLVYSTLCEQFGDNGSIKRKHSINESASSKSGSTKPQRKIISEESNVADRFRQLAGIKK